MPCMLRPTSISLRSLRPRLTRDTPIKPVAQAGHSPSPYAGPCSSSSYFSAYRVSTYANTTGELHHPLRHTFHSGKSRGHSLGQNQRSPDMASPSCNCSRQAVSFRRNRRRYPQNISMLQDIAGTALETCRNGCNALSTQVSRWNIFALLETPFVRQRRFSFASWEF